MVSNFFRIDGWPAAPALARDLLALRAAHDRECTCGTRLRARSIYRTKSEQHDIFVRRYRKGAFSPWGDYRRYQGAVWGRVDPGGPVASPDKISNHMRGLAVDFAIGKGSTCFWWLRRNAYRWHFNWIEGESIDEWWHWCWHVGIVPGKSTPDPWEGRGAPDPVPASDPGMTLTQLLGGTASTGTSRPAVAPEEEEDEMKNSGVYYEPSEGSVTYLLFNTGSGWFHEFSNGAGNGPMPGDYNNALAGTLGTGSWAKVTPGHAAVIKKSLDAVRAQSKS